MPPRNRSPAAPKGASGKTTTVAANAGVANDVSVSYFEEHGSELFQIVVVLIAIAFMEFEFSRSDSVCAMASMRASIGEFSQNNTAFSEQISALEKTRDLLKTDLKSCGEQFLNVSNQLSTLNRDVNNVKSSVESIWNEAEKERTRNPIDYRNNLLGRFNTVHTTVLGLKPSNTMAADKGHFLGQTVQNIVYGTMAAGVMGVMAVFAYKMLPSTGARPETVSEILARFGAKRGNRETFSRPPFI